MSQVFDTSAAYYDLLYKDKDYFGEAAYIHELIQKYSPGANTVLNLGCGTGKHDIYLEKKGYYVTGVDRSKTMLVEANKCSISGKLDFFYGDVRTVFLDKMFDVVVSLFHVISYQTTDDDILAAFRTANKHLKVGGVLIFDFWHGDGVLKEPPSVRVKCLEDESVKVVRTAKPVIDYSRNLVDVGYEIEVTEKRTGQDNHIKETHLMRYYFLKELQEFLSKAGFFVRDSFKWMSEKPLGSAWYGLVVAIKKDGL